MRNSAQVLMQQVYRIIQLVETLPTHQLESLIASHSCQLVLTRTRAKALGMLVDNNAVCLDLPSHATPSVVHDWSGLNTDAGSAHIPSMANTPPALAAVNLALHAHALPALIM